jgi:hypothetical protein
VAGEDNDGDDARKPNHTAGKMRLCAKVAREEINCRTPEDGTMLRVMVSTS